MEMAQVYETKIAELQKQVAEHKANLDSLETHVKKSNTLLLHYFKGVELVPQNREVLKNILKIFNLI